MQSIATRSAKGLAAFLLGLSFTALAAGATSLPPLVVAIRHGDCVTAVKLVNAQVSSNDDQTPFVAGRMLDEGLCVKKDAAAATPYFARAVDLGNRSAKLDYAAKVGLREGTEQSYEIAGDTCRSAGFDPQAKLSHYSLGYACTVLGVADKLLRETLPERAFLPGSAALVEFTPASAEMRIRSTPQVGRGDASTGSIVRRPLVDAEQVIKKAWRDALAAVPKPDATRLDNQTVELSLDVDMTLETDREVVTRSGIAATDGILLQGDYRQAGGAAPAGGH
jgi:TPR repeat protein